MNQDDGLDMGQDTLAAGDIDVLDDDFNIDDIDRSIDQEQDKLDLNQFVQ